MCFRARLASLSAPNLHHATQVDGQAVDPPRFLRAGLRLAGVIWFGEFEVGIIIRPRLPVTYYVDCVSSMPHRKRKTHRVPPM
jgi:hypothetical protein